ncbi:MAG TPA: GNAT family N-acetyltransferase [Chloroflexota bacterium]|nr:GNAT family N-acetyltransferase [Chloroflexota bacterium]
MPVMMPVAVRPTLVDPIGDVRWERLAATHPAGTAFHTPAWARVLVETYGYEPHYRALEGMDGELVAGLPSMLVRSFITGRRFVSLPFCDVCPPLINSDEEAIALLGLMVSDLSETGSRRIEVRGWSETAAPPASLIRSDAYVRHVVDLSGGPEAVFKGFNENMRRSIRKAEREKVRVRIGEDRADLATFVDLNLKLRRRHGMLPQPARFFTAVWKHFVEAGSGYLLLAERDAVPLAALLVLRHRTTALDKFAVSDSRYWSYRANHLLLWESMRMEAERGAMSYDLGRSDATASGLHQFKEGCGGVLRPQPYFFYPRAGGESQGDPKGLKKNLLSTFVGLAPDFLFKAAGNSVYRHLG